MAEKFAAALGPNVDAARNDLQRRRELKRLPKPELINIIRGYETGIAGLTARLDHAYGDEP